MFNVKIIMLNILKPSNLGFSFSSKGLDGSSTEHVAEVETNTSLCLIAAVLKESSKSSPEGHVFVFTGSISFKAQYIYQSISALPEVVV